jgi:myo-inositol 2-dehydrogenase / D-chiro-inositol 1-dehydrogenase
MKLRIGFLGVGAMGLSHVNQLHVKNAARAECVAICSRNDANIAKALAVAPKAKVFHNERELIHSDLDAVVISTPNSTHAALALESLKAGKHLFLEKPVGITAEECRAVLAAAEASDRVVLVGHELRYSPYFQKMKALVEAGEIGRPRMVWTREFRGPFQPKSGQWIQDARLSGGMMVDKNCHHFDLMNWWTGARPRRIAAFGRNATYETPEGRATRVPGSPQAERMWTRVTRPSEFGEHQVNDHSTVSFDYDNGVLGTLQVCLFARDFPEEELEMGIVGETGSLQTRIVPPGARLGNTPYPASGHPLPSSDEGRGKSIPPPCSPHPLPSRSEGRGQGEGCAPSQGILEILQWKRGTNQKAPIVHKVHSPAGEGWGNHLGFDEIHTAFLDAVLEGKLHLTSVRDCVDGTLLAIAAEQSIASGNMVSLP